MPLRHRVAQVVVAQVEGGQAAARAQQHASRAGAARAEAARVESELALLRAHAMHMPCTSEDAHVSTCMGCLLEPELARLEEALAVEGDTAQDPLETLGPSRHRREPVTDLGRRARQRAVVVVRPLAHGPQVGAKHVARVPVSTSLACNRQ